MLSLLREYEDARQAYQKAIESLEEFEAIKKASLQRLIANTWRSQVEYDQAELGYQVALSFLGSQPEDEPDPWWSEWIQINLELMILYYWMDDVSRLQGLLEEIKEPVNQFGSAIQIATYNSSLVRWYLRRDRFRVTDNTLDIRRKAVDLFKKFGTPADIASETFSLGFCLLWHGSLYEALQVLQSSLSQAKLIGDPTLQTRCLNYLTILFRLLGQVEKVREYAQFSLTLSQKTDMKDYHFTAMANQAWIVLRENKISEAESLFEEAIAFLNQHEIVHSFQWVARIPLIFIYLKKQHLSEAIEQVRILLSPRMHHLPDNIDGAFQEALNAWDEKLPEKAVFYLQSAVSMAADVGYL